jgi:hypothetical protein
MRLGEPAQKIANQRRSRHPLAALFTALAVLACAGSSLAQPMPNPIALCQENVHEVIAYYKSNQPATVVAGFRQRMPAQVTDSRLRASIHENLPTAFDKTKLTDAGLIEAVRAVLEPVLSLYGRSQTYDIIVIDSSTPLMMSDSGVVLVISTGMIGRALSDDELLGYTAHEVAHEYFAQYSIYSRHLLQLIANGGNEPALRHHLTEVMALIELQCDAFAALTLASLGYNPLEFTKGIERTRLDFPNHGIGNHASEAQRRAVIEGVVASDLLKMQPRQSEAFRRLKLLLAKREAARRNTPSMSKN